MSRIELLRVKRNYYQELVDLAKREIESLEAETEGQRQARRDRTFNALADYVENLRPPTREYQRKEEDSDV